tara:strand:+ start:150 stop:353 length:204 start_codon:yes stop_codon:yes gene_type:complete
MWVTLPRLAALLFIGETMKLKTKDEIITCLVDILSNNVSEYDKGYLVDKGWIEALKWVLGLHSENKM